MKRKIFSFVIILGGCAFLYWISLANPLLGWDFRNTLWGPAYMLVHHQTPYTYNTPYGPFPAVWMPTTVGLFFFLGYLPFLFASRLWLLVEIVGFLSVIWMINNRQMPTRWVFLECLVVFFLFPPLWVHIILGQFSMMFVLLMAVLVFFPQAKRFTPLLLVAGVTKPQLAILIYPGLLISTWRKSGFRAAAWLVLSTALCAALLTLPLFLYYPGWLGDFLFITFDNLNKGWRLPTLFVQLPLLFGSAGYGLWAVALLAAFAASLWFWLKKDAQTAMIASLALTPLVTPYASSWDFLLLLPAFFWLAIKLTSKTARVTLLAGMLALFVIQMGMRWHRDIPDGSLWWIPSALILLYLITLAVEHCRARKKVPGILQGAES